MLPLTQQITGGTRQQFLMITERPAPECGSAPSSSSCRTRPSRQSRGSVCFCAPQTEPSLPHSWWWRTDRTLKQREDSVHQKQQDWLTETYQIYMHLFSTCWSHWKFWNSFKIISKSFYIFKKFLFIFFSFVSCSNVQKHADTVSNIH